jgi:hypothetical protein
VHGVKENVRKGRVLFPGTGLLAASLSELVIRMNVNLMQWDAVVLGGQGNRVTNLEASDFEILQDGRAQRITNLSYIAASSRGEPDTSRKLTAREDRHWSPSPSGCAVM